MAGNNIKVNGQIDLSLNLSAQTAKKELEQLQKQLQTVANIELKVGHENQIGKVGEQIREASNAAMQLQSHLAAATNVKTGNLDFSKFSQSLGRDGKKLEEYRDALIALGPQGKNAFLGLANSIAKSEIPLKRTNKLLDAAWSNLKKTAGWQMSSSIVHGLIGSMQQAVGYAKDLDKSLNDIRIVTGASSDQMAQFAQQANKAAKSLSTTTTDYTKASLIYYQQGLSDAEVRARTETTIKMANATGTSAQKVSDQMTAIWNNYDNGSKSLTYYADVMAKLGAETASSTDEIAQGLQKFASISQTVGLSYEYAAAALATVTATSRESADVVGNAFKTLFARIQGLQLGETLEDGTDLNKYSQALNKVGISIKTSSGEMKSMDSILDEMGGKWNTLGKDQQMALAQTVAGVRQYTQLMNLMNNWDFFKQNVMSAENSEGTLNSQAAIFAESWQAASNRVRASFEGLWDSLINSDSFITVLDGFASIIGLVEKMVDGLGGAGGTLAMFGGILGKVFTPQIAQSVGEITMGIRQLSPKAREKDYATRKQWLQGFLNYSEVADEGERKVINRNLDKYAQESYIRDQRRALMTQQELDYDDRLQQKINDAREEQRLGAAQADAAKNKMTYLESGGLKGVLDSNYVTPEKMAAIQAYEKYKADFMGATGFKGLDDNTDETQFKNYLMNKKNGLSAQQADAYWKEFTGYKNAALNTPNIPFGNIPDTYKKVGTNKAVMQYAAVEAAKFKEGFTKDFWDNMTKDKNGKLIPAYDSIKEEIRNRAAGTLLNIDDLDEKFDSIMKSDGGIDKKLQLMREYVSDVSKTGMSSVIDSMDLPDEIKQQLRDKYGVAQQEFIDGKRRQASGRVNEQTGEQQRDENDKNAKTKLKMEGAVQMAQGASFMVAASQSIKAFVSSVDAASEGVGSFGDVLMSGTSVLMNGLMGISGVINGLKNMGVEEKLAGSIGGWAGAIMGVISLGVNMYKQHIENLNEEDKETIKATETEKKKAQANKDLIDSVDNAVTSYKAAEKAYEKGEATYDEVTAARSTIVEATNALSENYGISGLSSAALAGEADKVQELQYKERKRELDNLVVDLEKGKQAAGDILTRNLKRDGATYQGNVEDGADLQIGGKKIAWGGKEKDEASNQIVTAFMERKKAENDSLWAGKYGLNSYMRDDEYLTFQEIDWEDADTVVKLWDDFSTILNEMDAAGINATNSNTYSDLSKWVEANRTNVEAYKNAKADIDNLNVEQQALALEIYKVDNVKDFQEKRSALIASLTQGMDQNSEEYKKIEKAVDAYLGTLSNVINAEDGNLATAAAGIRDLYDDYSTHGGSMSEDEFSEKMSVLYEKYGNLIFSLNFDVAFNDSDSLESLVSSQLDSLRAQSNTLTIDVALNTHNQMKNLGISGSIADWNLINEQIRNELIKNANGIEQTAWSLILKGTEYERFIGSDGGLNLLALLTAPEGTFNELMSFYQNGLNQFKYGTGGTIDQTINANNARLDELGSVNESTGKGTGLIYESYLDKEAYLYGKKNFGIDDGADGTIDVSMFNSDMLAKSESERQQLLTSTADIMNDYYNAVLDGNMTESATLKQSLIESGYNADFLNRVENGIVAEQAEGYEGEKDWTNFAKGMISGTQAVEDFSNQTQEAANIQNQNNNLQTQKSDYYDTYELDAVRQEAAERGIDQGAINDLSQQYLAQNADYNPTLSNSDIENYAYGEGWAQNTELRKNFNSQTEMYEYLKGLHGEETQENYAESAQRRALSEIETQQGVDELAKSYDSLSKSLRNSTKHSTEWNSTMVAIKKSLAKVINVGDWTKISDSFVEAADAAGLLEKASKGDAKAISDLREQNVLLEEAFENGLLKEEDIAGKSFAQIAEMANTAFSGTPLEQWATDLSSVMDSLETFDVGELITGDSELNAKLTGVLTEMGAFSGSMGDMFDACSKLGITPEIVGPFSSYNDAVLAGFEGSQILQGDLDGNYSVANNVSESPTEASGGGNFYGVRFRKNGGGGGSSGGGGGGGGGEPKKVANKRKSQTVKRYKKNDMRRSSAQSAKKSASAQKDYLYGESKIAQMEKINKLAAKEAAITSDRIKESRKYMIEDRENLIKYMQKYGYEADFDSDGFLNTYEEAWGKIHDKIAKLYEDNELTDDEKKLEEDYKVELEELDGALEDYENSLKELQSDIEAYEESLYEMYDNKVEQMQHKVEFKIELNEDDLSYLDFWIEALGDSLYNALESLQTMGAKTNVLFDGINTYKQGIEDIYALSDDPFQAWATGGLDDILTADQVDALRENRDGLMDYMQQLLDLRQTMQDKVLDVFDKWQEKLSNTMSTIEHYGSVIEHFRNIMDVVGKDALGLDDQFMARFEQSAIDQSMDNIDATKAHYESLVSQNEEAQRRLAEARARGDKASEEHWQGVVDSTTEAMQSAQDSLLSSLESTLDMIASQFESAMTRAVEAFNDAIYEHGGLSGLSEDYSFMREQSDLMAQDYDKIYQLSKLNRNINKTLSDTNIIAGKQKMKSLQQEINELQASGVELSKYDLDYLQAKYELRLAEIELENAKNAKDTVRLSKDSEGNWSYIYTSSTDKVDEAQQKYEDALYAMQNLSYEYMEEMSNGMMQTSLAMMEKIQSLRIQDFDSYEAYAAEVKRIQDQYAGSLQNQQNELDKSMMNNQELYNQDWQAYSDMTGYKISAAQDWADNFSETTLGALMGSESSTSDFADTVFGLSNTLSNDLGTAAMSYFANVETAMNKYGTSINGFGSTVTTTVGNISTKSKAAANDMKTMAQEMNDAFTDITESVANWQKEFSGQIDSMLKEIGTLVQSINEAIQKSAEITGTKQVGDLIGSAEAAELLSGHEEYDFGDWKMDGSQLKVKGVGEDDYSATTFVEENAKLIDEINKKLLKYTEAKTGSEDRARLGEELEVLFKKYHAFKDIVSRVYDPTTLAALKLDNPNYASMDTGGYTGEWGDSGKFAMLHEKELVLNQDDTKNFLDALSISREVLHSMIEMNAKQSSLALGDLYPSSIQDMSQMLEQQVSITAEFPNATNRSDIEDAFNSLINTASQYANRYK